jgi:hypothetical protein
MSASSLPLRYGLANSAIVPGFDRELAGGDGVLH